MTSRTQCTDCRVALPEDDVTWVRDAWGERRPYCEACAEGYYPPDEAEPIHDTREEAAGER